MQDQHDGSNHQSGAWINNESPTFGIFTAITRSHISSHYTTLKSFDPSRTMEAHDEIQSTHRGCYTGLMWWWSLRVQLLHPRRVPYQNPLVIAFSPEGPIQSLSWAWWMSQLSHRALPQPLSTHTVTTAQPGALPEPLHFLSSPKGSHQTTGPYQTPSSPTKTDRQSSRCCLITTPTN